ncbi:hypothetical protein D3C78_1574270 [compost metagenome]
MIQRKGQIGFSTAKIDDRQRTSLRKRGQDILDHFQETIDLPELIVFLGQYFAFLIHDAKLNEKRNGCAFVQNILLAAIM